MFIVTKSFRLFQAILGIFDDLNLQSIKFVKNFKRICYNRERQTQNNIQKFMLNFCVNTKRKKCTCHVRDINQKVACSRKICDKDLKKQKYMFTMLATLTMLNMFKSFHASTWTPYSKVFPQCCWPSAFILPSHCIHDLTEIAKQFGSYKNDYQCETIAE